MSEPQYRMVNGDLVPLTQAEIDAIDAETTKAKQAATIANTTLDMGLTMFEILNGPANVRS